MSNLVNFGEDFESKTQKGITVVDFWASWCSPCRMLSPILDEIAAELSNVSFGQVDVDEYNELAHKYQVTSIPLVCIFKDGVLVDKSLGLVSKEELKDFIQKHLK